MHGETHSNVMRPVRNFSFTGSACFTCCVPVSSSYTDRAVAVLNTIFAYVTSPPPVVRIVTSAKPSHDCDSQIQFKIYLAANGACTQHESLVPLDAKVQLFVSAWLTICMGVTRAPAIR